MYELTRELKIGNVEGIANMPGNVSRLRTGFTVTYGDRRDANAMAIITVTNFEHVDMVTVASGSRDIVDRAYRDFLAATETQDSGYRSC